MPKLIVLRLHPEEPTTGADFTSYLAGLKIEAWDASFAKPKINPAVDTPIGEASGARIVQHWLPTLLFPPAAVATALLEITSPPASEYSDPDIVLRITRGGSLIGMLTTEYNVATVNVGAVPAPSAPPAPGPFSGLTPIALHVALPSPAETALPGDVIVTLPKDGSPPNFDDLKTAVEAVLAQDPGGAVDLKALTPAQSRHIAAEIAWNRHVAPLPMSDLERLYTSDGPGFDEKAYQIFDAELMKYAAQHNATAELMGDYVYAVAAALICEQKSIDAAAAGLVFPIRPNVPSPSGKIPQSEVVLTN